MLTCRHFTLAIFKRPLTDHAESAAAAAAAAALHRFNSIHANTHITLFSSSQQSSQPSTHSNLGMFHPRAAHSALLNSHTTCMCCAVLHAAAQPPSSGGSPCASPCRGPRHCHARAARVQQAPQDGAGGPSAPLALQAQQVGPLSAWLAV